MRLGIDFGTTRTLVAAVDRGNYPIVTFENADRGYQEWYPSLVAVSGDRRLYGFEAAERAFDPEWTLHRSFKRQLGTVGPAGHLFGAPVLTVLEEFLSSLREALETRSNLGAQGSLKVAIGVPANSNSNQRFLTIEAFRRAGFEVIGVYDEPSAAGIEYAHRYRRSDLTRKREHVLVYDLGGGTFDCSLILMSGGAHAVVRSSGLAQMGGDDFDMLLLEMVMERVPEANDRLLEICREAKERMNPNTRRILISIGDAETLVPIDEFYARCAPLIRQTIDVATSVLERTNAEDTIGCVYMVGGASEFPPVARALRARFGRRVRKSPYPHAATAIGLAVAADSQSDIQVERAFSRHFGVWREADSGAAAAFDPIFPKGSTIPSRVVRSYRPVHNIGHFRYLECDEIDGGCRPIGDIAPWDDIVFPFESALESGGPERVRALAPGSNVEVEEVYTCDENGIVQVTIRNLTAGYDRVYRLRR